MDPCGMHCDYIRRPYKTKATLFRDDPQDVDIAWYFCEPDAKRLPFPSPITVGNLSKLPWVKTSVGQVFAADTELMRPDAITPKPPGDHYHGTEADFREGCPYLPDEPPLARADDGIPLACRADAGLMFGIQGVRPSGWELSDGLGAEVTVPPAGFAFPGLYTVSSLWCLPIVFGPSQFGYVLGSSAVSRTYRVRVIATAPLETLGLKAGGNTPPIGGHSMFGPAASYDVSFVVPAGNTVLWVAIFPDFFQSALHAFHAFKEQVP